MEMVRISLVSYLNSVPFREVLEKDTDLGIALSLDIPSECARKLADGEVDLGLVPVAVLKDNPHYQVISDFCIGADGAVDSVLLLSDVPLNEIKKIYLDFHSRTSVRLVQVLCKEFWKINPEFLPAEDDFMTKVGNTHAAVLIGDRAFSGKKAFPFVYDLPEEWKKMTGLPFVFAVWASNIPLAEAWIKQFDFKIASGLRRLEEVALKYQDEYPEVNVLDYLTRKIDYRLDEQKRTAMARFLQYL
jgi:chorismate dehydratase